MQHRGRGLNPPLDSCPVRGRDSPRSDRGLELPGIREGKHTLRAIKQSQQDMVAALQREKRYPCPVLDALVQHDLRHPIK
jgi:hypothetical protein